MRSAKIPIRATLNAAFDDTLDYWFLSVPAVVSVLIGAVAIPFAQHLFINAPSGKETSALGGAVVVGALIAGVLINLSANFIIVRAWRNRDAGPPALSLGALALWHSAWRCLWTYAVWFVTYLAYVFALALLYVGLLVFAGTGFVAIFVETILAAIGTYVAWRFLRFLVSTVYLEIVLALTDYRGRRAVGEAIAAMKKRFWITSALVIITYAPAVLPDLFSVKADWRLHTFITCIIGGFFAVYGTLLTLYVFRAPKTVAVEVVAPAPLEPVTSPLLAEA